MFIPSNRLCSFPFWKMMNSLLFFLEKSKKSDRPPPSRPQGEGVKVLVVSNTAGNLSNKSDYMAYALPYMG